MHKYELIFIQKEQQNHIHCRETDGKSCDDLQGTKSDMSKYRMDDLTMRNPENAGEI